MRIVLGAGKQNTGRKSKEERREKGTQISNGWEVTL